MSEEIRKWEYQLYSLGSVLKSPKDEELMELLDEWGDDGWGWSQPYAARAPIV